MNHKYTLFKQNDKYILFLGTWLNCRKIPDALHIKHGIMSDDELDYVNARRMARFKWNEGDKIYEHAYSDKDNPITVSQLFLNQTMNHSIFIGRLRKAIFSWDVSKMKGEFKNVLL